MSYDEDLNESRLEHGTQVVEFLDQVKGTPEAADRIIEFYGHIASWRTDKDDRYGMIVDIMSDVAHRAHEDGMAFDKIVEDAGNGADTPYSEIYRLMEKALTEDGKDYGAALTLVEVNFNTELDLPAPRH